MSIPYFIHNLVIETNARIEVTLMPEFPYASKLDISLLGKPKLDLDIKALKSLNVMDLPGISSIIKDIITRYLSVKSNCFGWRVEARMFGGMSLSST